MPQDENKSLMPGEHSGFVAVDPVDTDWVSGAETGIIDTPRIPTGDWRPFLTAGKWQRFFWSSGSLETDACVSFSALDGLQAFMNWMVANNQYPASDVAWLKANGYFDAEGKISFSPRFTAKMSGTTLNGNSLPAVAASLRHDGAVPAKAWDAPIEQLQAIVGSAQKAAWDIYYADPGAANIALGQAFALRFDVQYEWIAYPAAPLTMEQFQQKLQASPLQIATAVCPPWNTPEVLQACGAGTAHATLMDNVEPTNFDIRDHYEPFDKRFASDYTITYAMRVVAASKNYQAPHFNYTFNKDLQLGMTDPDVTKLQDALKFDGVFPLAVQSTGYYGPITKKAVGDYQIKHGVLAAPTDPGYGRCGPMTRKALNAQFSQ